MLAPRLSAFWPGMTCQAEGGVLYVYAEGRLVSGLRVAELLGSRPDTADIENVLYQVLSTVQDDLLRDWGRWQTPELARRLDALKLALPEVQREVGGWDYRLPGGAVWALEPLRL